MVQLEQKHSRLGFVSFITSIVAGILALLTLGIATILGMSEPAELTTYSESAACVGIIVIVLFLASLVALGLGIGGLFQKNQKKIYAILGIAISAAIIVGMIIKEVTFYNVLAK
jgi:hypothetical protein